MKKKIHTLKNHIKYISKQGEFEIPNKLRAAHTMKTFWVW